MPDAASSIELLARDPVLFYSLLAALFLALVSLASGLARLDLLALARPDALLHVAVAVAAAAAVAVLARSAGAPADVAAIADPAAALPAGATPGAALGPGPGAIAWSELPWAGLARLPLYVVALAYGPSAGLLAAGLYAAFESSGGLPGWEQGVLTLELLVLGWLAIYPSPRAHRWAGPLDALLAYGLAWSTGGLALLAWRAGDVTWAGLLGQQAATAGGALAAALLLLLLPPAAYRALFPGSRLETGDEAARDDEPAEGEGDASAAPLRRASDLPLAHEPRRRRAALTDPGVPRGLRRTREERRLDPPPGFED